LRFSLSLNGLSYLHSLQKRPSRLQGKAFGAGVSVDPVG
jgi:hypothetical protein